MRATPATSHVSSELPAARFDPALVAILAGVCAALHVGKLPPAITALQAALGLSLMQAGFLLSLVQAAGMAAGVAFGALADGLGPRRSMLFGLAILALASALGGAADDATTLMVLRAAEGFGFLLVVLAAPALVRRLVAPARLSKMLGLWGAYMPLATAIALLAGPWVIALAGWRVWWWGLAALTVAMAIWLAAAVTAGPSGPAMRSQTGPRWVARLGSTLAAPGPWLVAMAFAMYSGQWLAVIGFLPTVYAEAGVAGTVAGALTALAAAANMIGNIAAGRLLHRGAPPTRLMSTGFVVMGLATAIAFAGFGAGVPIPAGLRYGAVLMFSAFGGLIPATLFVLAMRVAPDEGSISATVGWVQQWSALGQFGGPPLVAWMAVATGGWQSTWLVTAAFSLLGLLLTAGIARLLAADAPTRSTSSAKP
ncbi:CynX/NimT family MFS transporter [Piscinibacter sakaiensis]|uniref:MFS transporter n=1 Tax=Piscinibacter sakaiensis TaxID=1547922 RepID=UPI003AABB740